MNLKFTRLIGFFLLFNFSLHQVLFAFPILLEFDGTNTLKARYTHGAGIDEPLIMERLKEGTGNPPLPVPSFDAFSIPS